MKSTTKNKTIVIDGSVVQRVKVHAAKKDISIKSFVEEVLIAAMKESK